MLPDSIDYLAFFVIPPIVVCGLAVGVVVTALTSRLVAPTIRSLIVNIALGIGGAATGILIFLRGEPIEIWGDGRVVRDYLYVGDAMEAFLKVTAYTGAHRVFNIGSGEGQSVLEVLEAVEAVAGRRLARRVLPGRDFDVPTNVLDISRAREHLGWQPRTSLRRGLEQTFTWLLAH